MDWYGKKVLVTGAGGFIGSHLTEKCVECGAKVRGLVRYNSKNNFGWLEESKYRKEIELVVGDIRDLDSVTLALKGVDIVFHLAALIGIPYSYMSPLAYIRTNVEGTYNVLQAAKLLETENIVITSTSEVYGTAQYVPIDEQHPLNAQSPYSATKIAADQLALSFLHAYDLPVKIVRPFNTYGPRQSNRAIIPSVITQILDGATEIRLGNLYPTRDLTFVQDAVNGFIEVAACGEFFGQVVHVGMNQEISIGDLAGQIGQLLQKQVDIVADNQRKRPEGSEVARLVCNNSKLVNATGWKPQFSLETGLQETISWVEEHRALYKADIYNI